MRFLSLLKVYSPKLLQFLFFDYCKDNSFGKRRKRWPSRQGVFSETDAPLLGGFGRRLSGVALINISKRDTFARCLLDGIRETADLGAIT